jgi:hypothetical protein
MTHRESVHELAALLSPHNDARPTMLLGAGASYSSGIPLADESVKRIAKRVYAERVLGGKIVPEPVKTSEWREWLNAQPWFVSDEARLSENFPLVIKHLLHPRAYRQKVLLDLITPTEGIGPGYRHLAELVLRGLIGTILTANFDICLPQALNDKRPHIRQVAEVNRGVNEVVKQRGIAPRAWFENEGIAYEITRLGSVWGVRIKPFYMFTGPDAATPLPNYARTAKATRRMRFDRNESVGSDLAFWSRFLAQGAPVINIGQANVDDLLVEGSFLTIDVPEEGLIEDDDTDQGQMPA